MSSPRAAARYVPVSAALLVPLAHPASPLRAPSRSAARTCASRSRAPIVCYENACSGGTAGAENFQADVTVKNLTVQPLGTTDGTTWSTVAVPLAELLGGISGSGTSEVWMVGADTGGILRGTR